MAGKEKMTSVAASPPARRLSVSGAARKSREPAFEFTVPRQPRQRASSERSSRSSTPVRNSRGASPAETRRRPPSRPSSRPSTPTPKKKRNNELERLLISAVNDGQRRAANAVETKKGKKQASPVRKKVAVGAKKALDKAKKVPVKTKSKQLVKTTIKKTKPKLVAKKKAAQLKRAVGLVKKAEVKGKQAEPKGNVIKVEESVKEEVIAPNKEELPKNSKDTAKMSKETTKSAPVVLEQPIKDVAPEMKSSSEESQISPPNTKKETNDPIDNIKDALKIPLELLKKLEAVPKSSEEASKGNENAPRREDKPKVDVMQTLTEACRKLEQLKSKKKEPLAPEAGPRSPEGAAMTTENKPAERVVELPPIISPGNLLAKLRNKLSQSPSTDAKEGSIALPPPLPPLNPALIINSLSAAAKQTSSFLKDKDKDPEAPIEYRWRMDKRLSMLAPLNACIKGKVADLLRKNTNEVVLKENKRKEVEADEEMEELRLSESESESSAVSPEKTNPKLILDEASKLEKVEEKTKIEVEPEAEKEKEPEVEKKKEPVVEKVKEPVVEKEKEPEVEKEKEPEAKKASEPIVESETIEDEPSPIADVPELDCPTEMETETEITNKETELKETVVEELTAATAVEPSEVEMTKKLSKQRKESERKKKKREDYRKRKLEAAIKAEEERKAAEEASVEAGASTSEAYSPASSTQTLSPKGNGETAVVASSPESREEDIVAKESVLGALGLQSTRLAQQERPKVPKLKLVVRPTPAKKKGHRSETGNEKTYAICHEGDGEDGQKNSHRKKSLWYPGLPISNGELAKLILTTPTISDLIIGRHLGEAKPPQPGIGVGDGLDTEAELGQKGAKKRDEVVIPEKTAASNVHPGRPCEDVCCYCHNKFGLFDTPLHVSQLKGGHEKQSAVLAREPVLTLASCVCDACFRHLDRPLASVAAWRPPQAKAKKQRETSVCCFAGCNRPAPHPLVKRWKRRVRGLLSRGLDTKSGLFLCHQHHQETAKIGACVLCGRRAASSQLYCLEPQATEPFNEVLRQDLIPIIVRPEADLCKKCRYYSSLRLRCSDYTKLSVSNRAFLRSHREKVIKSLCPTDTAALVEVFPEVPKQTAKKLMPPPPPPPASSTMSAPSTPKRTLLTPSVEIIPVPAEGPPPTKKSRGPPAPAKEAVTVRLVGGPSTSSSSNIPAAVAPPPRRPLVKRTARHEGPNLTFQWLGETGPPRGRWHTTRADIQMDDRTLAEWKKRQEPFGSYTSYVKHLVTLDGFWRAKQLGPMPGASAACNKYCTSVRNRIEAYEGRGEEPEEFNQPRICDVRSLAE